MFSVSFFETTATDGTEFHFGIWLLFSVNFHLLQFVKPLGALHIKGAIGHRHLLLPKEEKNENMNLGYKQVITHCSFVCLFVVLFCLMWSNTHPEELLLKNLENRFTPCEWGLGLWYIVYVHGTNLTL